MKRVHWHILSIQLLNFLSIFACVSFCHRRSFNQLPELGAAKWPYGEWMTVYWQASSSARCFICIVALKPKNNFLIKVDVSILKVMETGSARWSDTLRLVCLKGRAGMWLALPPRCIPFSCQSFARQHWVSENLDSCPPSALSPLKWGQ